MPDKIHRIKGNDPRLRNPRRRNDCRVIETNDGPWQWKTNGRRVTLYDPDGQRHDVPYWEMIGMSREKFMEGVQTEDEDGPCVAAHEISPLVIRGHLQKIV